MLHFILLQKNYPLFVTSLSKIFKEMKKYMYSMYILGVFNPLTVEGNYIVDGVLASCYASTQHDVAHYMMKPNQWYPEIINWIFGINDGSPVYVTTFKEVKKWLHPNDI